jgi:hypothetical protein
MLGIPVSVKTLLQGSDREASGNDGVSRVPEHLFSDIIPELIAVERQNWLGSDRIGNYLIAVSTLKLLIEDIPDSF